MLQAARLMWRAVAHAWAALRGLDVRAYFAAVTAGCRSGLAWCWLEPPAAPSAVIRGLARLVTKALCTAWIRLGDNNLSVMRGYASDSKGCRLMLLAWYGMYCPGLRVAS